MSDLEKCIAEIEFRFPCVRDHEFTSKEWQTLKAAVLAQQTGNSAMDAISALRALYDACVQADSKGELPDVIDGSLLDRAKDVLKLHQ